MRLFITLILIGPLLSACGLRERFDSAENRINAALPLDSGVKAARQLFLSQTADQPDLQKALEPMWAARLRLRALSCSRDFTPTWRDSMTDVRARLTNTSCFAESDRSLQRWLGLQRARLLLLKGPIRPAPQALPPMISLREFISTFVVARDAPVALARGPTGFEVVELESGKSLFKDVDSQFSQAVMDLSPNGRLFTRAASGKLSIRATEGGETLVELPQTDAIFWFDSNVVALRSNATPNLRLLDLATGDETPVTGTDNGSAFAAVPAPGAPNRFNLLSSRGADQFEIVNVGGRYEAQLRAERRSASGSGFATNTGGMSADGTTWIAGHQGLRVLNLDTLELNEISFNPVATQTAWPTPNPQEFLLSASLPTGDAVSSHFKYFVYAHHAGTLAQVTREPGSSTRYQYIASIKRLALIDNQKVRYLDKLPTSEPQPVATVLAAFIDEMNQRRLASAALPSTGPGLPTGSAAARGTGEMTPLQAQLRDAQVEGVGVYQGARAQHSGGQTRTAGFVEVRVRRSSRPIALVLSSYEPVRWTLVMEPGAKLSSVLVSGYHDSTVIGAGAARVYQIGQGHAYEQQSSSYAELQRTVLRWAGKPMMVFQGRYEGSSFSVGGGY